MATNIFSQVWKLGFGFSDIENRVMANPNTVMRIASISKSMTMAVVAKLWEDGKIDLVPAYFV
jgi:serine beta-lactamase-like protein LACTB